MPGKVNPVVPEAVLQVCAQVVGNDAAVAFAGAAGNFELNVMLPVMARNLLESIRLLATAARLLADRCVDGIDRRRRRTLRELAESSPAIVTPLNRYLGYDEAAAGRQAGARKERRRSARSWSSAGTSRAASSPRSSSTRRSTSLRMARPVE